jgi:EAL domain-containing protein (putative c-di-GMP-specific phosphodiesterase class I)
LDQWTSYPEFFISINISARDLLDQYLPEVVEQALKSCGNVKPSRLKLELTERISMDDPAASISAMNEIDAMGVEIWIDDFGTGQSSLSYLKHLPARMLKIDRVFIDAIEDDPKDLEYLSSIVRAIRSRDKEIVIEGVSTPQQVEHLRAIDCSMMQGFHFSKGLPADALEVLISKGARLPTNGQGSS